VNEPFVHGYTLREEGQVKLWKLPNELSAGATVSASGKRCQYYFVCESQSLRCAALSGSHHRGDHQITFHSLTVVFIGKVVFSTLIHSNW